LSCRIHPPSERFRDIPEYRAVFLLAPQELIQEKSLKKAVAKTASEPKQGRPEATLGSAHRTLGKRIDCVRAAILCATIKDGNFSQRRIK
jgi:hypothetical protein